LIRAWHRSNGYLITQLFRLLSLFVVINSKTKVKSPDTKAVIGRSVVWTGFTTSQSLGAALTAAVSRAMRPDAVIPFSYVK
jgi:hypothetical protein